MENKNTNKVTQFESKSQAKAQKKEKLIVTASAVFVLAALTLTGMYINNTNAQKDPILEDSTGIQGDMSGGVMQTPGLENIEDLQIVDSTTVENPGRTGNNTETTEGQKAPATKSSNTLTGEATQETETTELAAEEAMSEMVESMMLSFNGMQMIWPVAEENEVLIPYSMDKAVYFETLDQYKYSPAMVISAEVGTPVYAVSAGKITGRYWDYETGWTYEMDLGGGFKAYYGQLDNMQKAEDTYVVAGDVLGYVAAPTKYYSEEGSNLYFAMTKNDRPVYPKDYMGE